MIYCISGRARSGKDTVAKIIQLANLWINNQSYRNESIQSFIKNELDRISKTYLNVHCDWKSIAFADKLKEIVAALFDIPIKNLYDEDFKRSANSLNLSDSSGHIYTYRELLQRIGTEVGRNIDPDVWIKVVLDKIKDPKFNYIITDVRFINEAEACKNVGAKLIRVECPTSEKMEHSSENDLDNYEGFDITINNDGTIDDLINKVLQLNLV